MDEILIFVLLSCYNANVAILMQVNICVSGLQQNYKSTDLYFIKRHCELT